MNGSAKRLMAVFVVFAMIASAVVVIMVDEQDSSADPVDCKQYYYNQLDTDLARNAYNAIKNLTSFGGTARIDFTSSDKTAIASDENYVRTELAKARDAMGWDNPLTDYYFRNYMFTSTENYVDVTPQTFDGTTFSGTKSTIDDALSTTWMDNFAVDTSKSTYNQIKDIHKMVTDKLTYDTANASSEDPKIAGTIRSVYTAMNPATNNVVCEGYAKMFKVICDHYNIDCIIVCGMAGAIGSQDAHMWNYVKYNDYWFVVDCTWDDKDGDEPYLNYLLAGTGKSVSLASGPITVGESHNPCGISSSYTFNEVFELPILSALSVQESGDIEGGTQHLVTFLYEPAGLEPERIYVKQYVINEGTIIIPEDPADSLGHHFFGWYQHESDTEFDFTAPITADVTVDGKWTDVEVYALKYDTQGGTNIQATRVEYDNNTTKITSSIPRKEGFNFVEWNTAKDGKGVSFKAGDDITLLGDCTLYAVWEDTTTVTYKIDSIMDKAAKFLSDETIPGVSNLLLTIGVITTVISLIAVLAIARK